MRADWPELVGGGKRASWNLQFSLRAFLLLPLLVAPLLMAPVYYRITPQDGPWLEFFSYLIVPACYVALWAVCGARRGLVKRPGPIGSIVFTALTHGIVFGTLYVTASMGPLAVMYVADSISEFRAQLPPVARASRLPPSYLLHLGREILTIAGFVLLHAVVIGAAIGGIVGLAVDWLSRRSDFKKRH
jgi:hypothetical protein